MAWIMDTYSMHKGYSVPAVITGKPVEIGGTVGRESATGLGITYVTRAVLKRRLGHGIEEATVGRAGLGNVGSWAARSMDQRGARIVAVQRSLWRNPQSPGNGSAPPHAPRRPNWHGDGFPLGEPLSNEELLELERRRARARRAGGADHPRQRRPHSRARHRRGANGPVTPEADRTSTKRACS